MENTKEVKRPLSKAQGQKQFALQLLKLLILTFQNQSLFDCSEFFAQYCAFMLMENELRIFCVVDKKFENDTLVSKVRGSIAQFLKNSHKMAIREGGKLFRNDDLKNFVKSKNV